MKVTILGCGSSMGVPAIGCRCRVCRSDNPRNKRTRVSVFVETHHINLLIDTSPDLRQQALREGITRVDAVLYTHDHADHAHGIDDLRSFNYLSNSGLPIYSNAKTIDLLKQHFPYTLVGKPDVWFRPFLIPYALPDAPVHRFNVHGVDVTSFEQQHGRVKTLGYRIGNFAYSTDVNALPESAFEALAAVEVWVVDCLRHSASYSHSSLSGTLAWIERVRPRLAILTHMSHDFDYDTLLSELPAGVVPGYDGMIIEL